MLNKGIVVYVLIGRLHISLHVYVGKVIFYSALIMDMWSYFKCLGHDTSVRQHNKSEHWAPCRNQTRSTEKCLKATLNPNKQQMYVQDFRNGGLFGTIVSQTHRNKLLLESLWKIKYSCPKWDSSSSIDPFWIHPCLVQFKNHCSNHFLSGKQVNVDLINSNSKAILVIRK